MEPAPAPGRPDDLPTIVGPIFDRAPDMVILLSHSGSVLEVNRSALDFTGWTRNAVVGRPLWAIATYAETRERLRDAVERAAAGHEVRTRERIRDRAGRERIVDIELNAVVGGDEAAALLVLVARDVTEAEHALQELLDSREKYAGIVNISADAIISIDDHYRITDFNHGAEKIFGYSRTEVLGRSLEILIPHRFRTAHVSHVRSFGNAPERARRMGERREISALRKGGQEFPADASISKQVVDGGRFYTVVLRDITRQKRVEWSQRFLARAGSLLASSLDVTTTLESIARLAADDAIADCCVIFDASDGAVIRRAAIASRDPRCESILEQFRGESLAPGSSHPAARVIATGDPVRITKPSDLPVDDGGRDLELMHRLGVTSAILVPLVARGRIGGAIGLYLRSGERSYGPEDLALASELAVSSALAVDNARLYEAARRAVRARDEILAVVSHDLGNPLAAARIGTTVLGRTLAGRADTAEAAEQLRGVRKSIDQMDHLIRDLMDVERIEAGPLVLGAKPVRPSTVVASVIEMFNGIAAARPVALRSRVPAHSPTVRADRERLVQALSNLVGNAVKFTQPGGTIEIIVEPVEGEVQFSVCDDGPGIDPSHLDHIFDRFWRDARGERGPRGGLGLGLAIVKGIVAAHGGRVWADSEPGKGTRVHFTVPIAGSSPGRAATVRSSPTAEEDIA